MKRIFNRRVLFRTLASLITIYILFVIIENWTGPHALAAAKAKLLAEGETLDFTAIDPPPPPEAQNFCTIEPLAGIKESNNKPAEALKALDWSILHNDSLDSVKAGNAPDLKPLMDHLAAKGIGKKDASPAEMLAALDATHPVLKSLADAAPLRPAAQFIPRIGKDRPDMQHHEIDYTHFTQTQHLSKALLLRCNLAIAAGHAGDAVNCIQASLRLAEAHLQEPVLLGLLVGSTIQASTMSRVWALLHARITTEAELAILQNDIARLDLLAAMLRATRGELAVAAHTLAALRSRPETRSDLYGSRQDGFEPESESSLGADLLYALLPSGFDENSEAHMISEGLNHLILPMRNQDFKTFFPSFDRLKERIKENRQITRPHHWLAAFNMGTHSRSMRRVAEAETNRRHALAAIAIERIRQAEGALPTTLPAGHLDFMDGKPMRYRLEGDGYLLWSVSLDNEDDGGKRHPRSGSFTGDWVWQMPAGE